MAAKADTPISLPTRMFIAGCGGTGAAACCHPIDVVRINMQIYRYKGVLDACGTIVRNDGIIGGLYPGVDAAFLRQWTYGTFRLGLSSFLKEKMEAGGAGPLPFHKKLLVGGVAGAIGSFIGNPCEVAMVRLSADSKAPVEDRRGYKNAIDTLVRITREEGVSALFAGVTPTVLRAILLSAATIGVYGETKERLCAAFPTVFTKQTSPATMFTGSLVSSFAANLVCCPFDVIKSRLQNMPAPAPGQPALYNGMVDCLVKSMAKDGPFVVYRGFFPAFIKLAPYTTISFVLVEQITMSWTGKGM